MRSISFFKQKLRNDKKLKSERNPRRSFMESKLTSEDDELMELMEVEIFKIRDDLKNKNQLYTINWLDGWKDYYNDKLGNNNDFRYENRSIPRGSNVLINLFGHMNPELTFKHPAVVLYQFENKDILVAPVSSMCFNSGYDFHIDLTPGEDNVNNNCAVKINDMRVISTKRIKNIFPKRISDNKLNLIDDIIVEYFANSKKKDMDQLIKDLEEKEKEHIQLIKDLEEKEKENIHLVTVLDGKEDITKKTIIEEDLEKKIVV